MFFLVFKITDTAIKLNQGQTKKSWRWEQGEKAVLGKNQLHSTPWDFWNLFARGQSKWHSWLWPTECQPASRCEIPNGYSIGCMVACNVWPDILLTWDKKKLTIVYTVYICIYIYYIFTSPIDVKEVCSSKSPKNNVKIIFSLFQKYFLFRKSIVKKLSSHIYIIRYKENNRRQHSRDQSVCTCTIVLRCVINQMIYT